MGKFSRKDLAEYIADNLSDPNITQNIAGFLIDNGKTSELESILRDVADLRASERGVVELTAVSAYPLDSSAKSEIENMVMSHFNNVKQVIIHEEIDKTVIGGVNLSFANSNLDLTIRAKLNKLRTSIA